MLKTHVRLCNSVVHVHNVFQEKYNQLSSDSNQAKGSSKREG